MTNQAPTYEQLLERWQYVKAQLNAMKNEENELRQQLFAGAFPTPKEGTNNFTLRDGRKVKGTHKINRSVSDGEGLVGELAGIGVNDPTKYLTWKPELKVGAYKSAPTEERAILDKYVTSKPGLPELKVE